jgi:hypothetical protein
MPGGRPPAAAYGVAQSSSPVSVAAHDAPPELKPLTAAELTAIAVKPPKQAEPGIEEVGRGCSACMHGALSSPCGARHACRAACAPAGCPACGMHAWAAGEWWFCVRAATRRQPRVGAVLHSRPAHHCHAIMSARMPASPASLTRCLTLAACPPTAQSIYPNAEIVVRRLKWQFWIMNFLVLAHIVLIAYTDPLDTVSMTVTILTVG